MAPKDVPVGVCLCLCVCARVSVCLYVCVLTLWHSEKATFCSCDYGCHCDSFLGNPNKSKGLIKVFL